PPCSARGAASQGARRSSPGRLRREVPGCRPRRWSRSTIMPGLLSRNGRSLAILFSLGVVVLISFWEVTHCDFINFDDDVYVTGNAPVQQGITPDAIRWAFTTDHNANWFPLTWLSHMLDVQLFGLDPHWHHVTNLLFHLANTLLLFFVLHR